jgi:hypothetical protein
MNPKHYRQYDASDIEFTVDTESLRSWAKACEGVGVAVKDVEQAFRLLSDHVKGNVFTFDSYPSVQKAEIPAPDKRAIEMM